VSILALGPTQHPKSGVDHTLPSTAKVTGEELYLYSPLWEFMAYSMVNFTIPSHTQNRLYSTQS
jgi:hypothetical protein